MAKCKITVIKREFYPDLAEKYCGKDTSACQLYTDGQEFFAESLEKPQGFCAHAWHDLIPTIQVLMRGGSFSPWMKDPTTLISCCTDGIRPVVFEMKRVE